jgi:hypothetical protein
MSSSVCTAASAGTSGNFLKLLSSNLNWNFVPGKKKLSELNYHKLKMSEIFLPRWNWFARDFLSPDSSGPIQRVGANHRLAICVNLQLNMMSNKNYIQQICTSTWFSKRPIISKSSSSSPKGLTATSPSFNQDK